MGTPHSCMIYGHVSFTNMAFPTAKLDDWRAPALKIAKILAPGPFPKGEKLEARRMATQAVTQALSYKG